MITVAISNYQILRDARMAFVPGLNVIVGPSNNGKTAVFRAIHTAVYNEAHPEHVTVGEMVSKVHLGLGGHAVAWERDARKASPVTYVVDGQAYAKVGRGEVGEIADVLGMGMFEVDVEKYHVNWLRQMEYPFLLDLTPAKLFKFVAVHTSDGALEAVLDDVKRDLSQSSGERKRQEGYREAVQESFGREKELHDAVAGRQPLYQEITDLEAQVQEYVELLSLQGVCVRLEESLRDAESKQGEFSKALRGYEGLADVGGALAKYEEVVEAGLECIKKRRLWDEAVTRQQQAEDTWNDVVTQLAEFTVCPYCGNEIREDLHDG